MDWRLITNNIRLTDYLILFKLVIWEWGIPCLFLKKMNKRAPIFLKNALIVFIYG